MNLLKQIFKTGEKVAELSHPKAEPMTESKVDFSFRIYWTKVTRSWNRARREEVRQQVQTITHMPEFHRNLIDKRYNLPLEEIPEKNHSGASLIALLEVLDALDAIEESEKNL